MSIKAPGAPWRLEVDVTRIGRTVEVPVERVVEVPVDRIVEKRVEVESTEARVLRMALDARVAQLERENAQALSDLARAKRVVRVEQVRVDVPVRSIPNSFYIYAAALIASAFCVGLFL